MGKGDAEMGEPFEDATKDHRTDREAGLGRHANQPREPIFGHPLFSHHVPWVHKDGCAQVCGRLENGKDLTGIQIPIVNVRANLDARQR